MHLFIAVLVVGLLIHLAGGARSHRRHHRQHGARPNLYYTYGRGWWGSINLFGFRIGHRL